MNKEQNIITTINLVAKALSQKGLAKDQQNLIQRYKYRGIDPLYDLISPLLSQNGLVIIPELLTHSLNSVGKTEKGANIYQALTTVKFTFAHIHNEQVINSVFVGEALDSSDKAFNKAMTAAYKYMIIQLFAIPINGTEDDADTHSPVVIPDPVIKKCVQEVEEVDLHTLYKSKSHLIKDDWITRIEQVLESGTEEEIQKVRIWLEKLS